MDQEFDRYRRWRPWKPHASSQMAATTFKLRFPPHEAEQWIAFWQKSKYAKLERDALRAGKQLALGHCTRELVEAVIAWKSPRSKSQVHRNSIGAMREVLSAAQKLSPKLAINLLTGLDGFGVSVASAFLTAMNRKKYTVIDWRALDALSSDAPYHQYGAIYTPYLDECGKLIDVLGLKSLREVDHALWGWSVGNSRSVRGNPS